MIEKNMIPEKDTPFTEAVEKVRNDIDKIRKSVYEEYKRDMARPILRRTNGTIYYDEKDAEYNPTDDLGDSRTDEEVKTAIGRKYSRDENYDFQISKYLIGEFIERGLRSDAVDYFLGNPKFLDNVCDVIKEKLKIERNYKEEIIDGKKKVTYLQYGDGPEDELYKTRENYIKSTKKHMEALKKLTDKGDK